MEENGATLLNSFTCKLDKTKTKTKIHEKRRNVKNSKKVGDRFEKTEIFKFDMCEPRDVLKQT